MSTIFFSSRQAGLLAATFSLPAFASPAFAQSHDKRVAPPVTQGSVKQLREKIASIRAEDAERQKKQDAEYALAVEAAKKAKQPIPPKPAKVKAKTGYLDAYLDYIEQRAFPNDTVDFQAIYQASEDRDAMEPFRGIARRLSEKMDRSGQRGIGFRVPLPPTTWQFIGPRNLTTPYQTYYGPSTSATSGRINGIAHHPTNSNIAYLAAAGGGAWKTVDGGVNWTSIDKGFPSQNTGCVAVDPVNGDTVYIGMGDFNGGRGDGGGVMKSTDGGANWTRLDSSNSAFISKRVSVIVIDPDNTNRLIAVGGRGSAGDAAVFVSTNGGVSWTTTLGNVPGWYLNDLEFSPLKTTTADPTQPNKRFLYASEDYYDIYRSADSGATWTTLSRPGNMGRFNEIAVSPTDANVVYASITGSQTIYKGTRNPATDTYTWVAVSTGFPSGAANVGTSYNWSQDGYDHSLSAVGQKISPTSPISDFLYSSLITLAGKRGENNWQDIGVTYTNGALTHNDQHSFAAFPGDPNRMLFGNDGGVYGLTYSPTTGAYTINDRLSATLGVTMFYYADFHPTNPLWVVGGTQDNATPVMRGDSANWLNKGGGDGGGSAINPLDPLRQYATVQFGGFYWTNTGWNGFSSSDLPLVNGYDDGEFTARLSIDPNAPNPVYYGGRQYLHRFNVANRGIGGTWETQLGNYSFGNQVLAITVAPSDSRIIYVGTEGGRLARSTDYGATWTVINGSLPNRVRKDIWVNPENPADVIVVLSGTGSPHVYRSANALAATPVWTNISGTGTGVLPDIPVNSITRDPFDKTGNTFFIGADNGVYATENGGQTWTNATAPLGLPNVQVSTVKAMAGTGYLMASTYGRGMYRIPLTASIPDLKPDLRITQTQSRAGTIRFVITLNNIGGTTANTLRLTSAELRVGSVRTPATTALPASLPNTVPGSASSVTLDFPVGAGAANAPALMSIKGTYAFGTNTGSFGSTAAINLP